ncbi:MAG: hypothetical protein K6T81_03290 [Alicyclobacillus macrosporangiidus]|uniref:hypothetical protein n=1 Tax=Alicyclobacillus macrosporangiidus TaxID=392015 RepID=UPI0026EA833D|nr:hypothetical protein [Alicyclobacillus macrosporangiidus]MCL6597747.1 hypothetical protein [Alicyclobacillus macrosporangiidus]
MKRVWWMAALLILATGCGPKATAPAATTTPFNAVAEANAAGADGAVGNAAGNATDAAPTDADMKKTAHDLVEMYIQSHNDKTLTDFKADLNRFFAPGLSSVVGQMASKGVDFAHPVERYTIDVQQVQPIDNKNFTAVVKADVQYKGEPVEHHQYHVTFVEYNMQWYIRLIGG